jgi:flagellar motor switch/type III secretory pathway protein FliN
MSQEARAWLPDETLRDGALARALAACIDTWVEHWLAEPRRVEVRASTASPPEAAPTFCCGALTLALDPRAPLGLWMLGLGAGVGKTNPADDMLLKRLATVAAADLLDRLRPTFGLNAGIKEERRHPRIDDVAFSFSLGGASNLIHLFVPSSLAVQARKALLPPQEPPLLPRPRAEALARQLVRVGAMLGEARISLVDVRSLAIGDVVVLDRGGADALALTVDGSPIAVPCELGAVDEAMTLRLRPPSMPESASL